MTDEIYTKDLHLDQKKFYIDVKVNPRGKFVKITESHRNGLKSRISLSMAKLPKMIECLENLKEINLKNSPPHVVNGGSSVSGNAAASASDMPDEAGDNKEGAEIIKDRYGRNLIKSFVISGDNRKFYLDLRTNSRGRFVRIAMIRERPWETENRVQLSFGAANLTQFLSELSAVHANCFEQGDELERVMPESRKLRAFGKLFYFDVASNYRGFFMSVSEIQPMFRTSIIVSQRIWQRFADIMADFDRKVAPYKDDSASSSHSNKTDDVANTAGGAGDTEVSAADSTTSPKKESTDNHTAGGDATLPGSQTLRGNFKTFYFDCARNNRGVFLRISEVRQDYRTAVTFPRQCWSNVVEYFSYYIQAINELGGTTQPKVVTATPNSAE